MSTKRKAFLISSICLYAFAVFGQWIIMMTVHPGAYAEQAEKRLITRLPRRLSAVILISLLLALFFAHAHADTGPHPSVSVTFTNLPDSVHYATLLAEKEFYGPHRAVSEPQMNSSYERFLASSAFLEVAARTGYYYWGHLYEIKDGRIRWGYYPPERFMILLYDEAAETVYASAETERFAFDSVYRVTLREDGTLDVEKESRQFKTISNAAVRLVTTVLVEILVALLFGYKVKQELLIIGITNILTQVLLNWYLIVGNTFPDTMIWLFRFLTMELAVFIGEAIAYSKLLKSHSRKRAVLYAMAANTASLLSGPLIDGILM